MAQDGNDGSGHSSDPPGAQVPRDLWAGIPRRTAPSPVERGAPPPPPHPMRATSPPPPPSGGSATPHLDERSDEHLPLASELPHAPGRRRRGDQPRRARWSRRRRLAAAGAGLALVAGAIVVPQVVGGPDEPRMTRPTSGPLRIPDALAEGALRPHFITAPDRSAEMPLPPALGAEAQRVAGTGATWRTEPDVLEDLWWTAFPGTSGWGETAAVGRAASAVHVEIVPAGAAHEANVSDTVVGVLSAYALTGEQAERRLLIGIDADTGTVEWSAALDGTPVACQVVGRGASVACALLEPSDDDVTLPNPTVTVFDAASGETITQFVVMGCWPLQFLQVDTRLYWAGMSYGDQIAACLGGGEKQFAAIPDAGWVPGEALSLTSTGPVLRTEAGSVLLTPSGWTGYDGWVEPGPEGVVVREIGAVDVDGQGVRTVVSGYDGATLFSVRGTAWRRLDLLPDAQAEPTMRELVGIGSGAYRTDGQQVVRLLSNDGTPAEPQVGLTGTTLATPTGIWMGAGDGGTADRAWVYEGLFDPAGSRSVKSRSHPPRPVRAVGDQTLAVDATSGESFEERGPKLPENVTLSYSVTKVALTDRDGEVLAFSATVLQAISVSEDDTSQSFIGLGAGLAGENATVVGSKIVSVDLGAVVATG